jgi:hypothetical protein
LNPEFLKSFLSTNYIDIDYFRGIGGIWKIGEAKKHCREHLDIYL